MFPGMNASKMAGMMKKMGISQTQLPVRRVVFEMDDGNLVIEEPSVIRIMMQGQETFQVSGETSNVVTGDGEQVVDDLFSEDDVSLVMEQTGKTIEEVKEALEKTAGDIAEAIVSLK